MGEFELIARLAPHLAKVGGDVLLGSGDDAAVLRVGGIHLCVTVDVLVEGIHFRRGRGALEDIGWKAVAVNVSDLAAMGATPLAAVVGLTRPHAVPESEIVAVYAGMADAARHWGLALVGGDTVSGRDLSLAVTALGTLDGPPVRRSGARPGDRVAVVGWLGGAGAGLALEERGRSGDEGLLAAHRRPRALVRAGRLLREAGATAMIDVSDGLGADLAHVCRASGVAARIEATALPVSPAVATTAAELGLDVLDLACAGGEDYALVASLPPDVPADVLDAVRAAEDVPAVVIGAFLPPGGPRVGLVLPDGSLRDITAGGFDHYAGPDDGEEDQ